MAVVATEVADITVADTDAAVIAVAGTDAVATGVVGMGVGEVIEGRRRCTQSMAVKGDLVS
jgi:hypothetical protein